MTKLILAFLFFGIVGSACQRSPQYRKEEDYGLQGSQAKYGAATQKAEALGQPKKRVYVLSFWNDTPFNEGELGEVVADELKRGLFLSQRVLVPTDVKSHMGSHDLVDKDQVKVAQLIREGRRLDVSLLIVGKISKIVFRQQGEDVGIFRRKTSLAAIDLEMKIFDIQAGREIYSSSKSGEAASSSLLAVEAEKLESAAYRSELVQSALREAVAQLIPEVVKTTDKTLWQGRVAKIHGSKFFINAGRKTGLINGDILRVLTGGDDVYDPLTGAYLGRSKGQLKGTLEVVDFIGPEGAVAEVHTGGNFQEGDVVQLY